MHWRCRAGQIVNLIHFNFEWIYNIVSHQFKIRIIKVMSTFFFVPV